MLILPILHVILCFVVELGMSDDGWKWFLPALIDFPSSELFRQVKVLPQFDAFLIFGTLWWYCVGLVYRFFYVLLVGNDNSKHPTT